MREVEEFPINPAIVPNTHYVNSMYVYPITVQFQNKRNIAVKVQLRLNDSVLDAGGKNNLQTIFGRSSMTAFTNQMPTAVTWHNRTPSFNSEIKIMLPFALDERVYIKIKKKPLHTQHNINNNPAHSNQTQNPKLKTQTHNTPHSTPLTKKKNKH